jgi:hypothetical protein
MVDSIKNDPRISQTRSVVRNDASLRENFRQLSSGLSVSQAAQEAQVTSNSPKGRPQVNKLVNNLNDAVKFSREALQALEKVVSEEEAGSVIGEFTADLERLRLDIVDLLEDLRSRARTAEVISENIEAADARLEDVERAGAKAREASVQIQFRSEEALQAHGALTLEKVNRLLDEA